MFGGRVNSAQPIRLSVACVRLEYYVIELSCYLSCFHLTNVFSYISLITDIEYRTFLYSAVNSSSQSEHVPIPRVFVSVCVSYHIKCDRTSLTDSLYPELLALLSQEQTKLRHWEYPWWNEILEGMIDGRSDGNWLLAWSNITSRSMHYSQYIYVPRSTRGFMRR